MDEDEVMAEAVVAEVAPEPQEEEILEAIKVEDSNTQIQDEDSQHGVAVNDNNESFNVDARRRLKNEARLTSGIGKAKEKDRNLEIFWKEIWPKLEEYGWTKHEGSGQQAGSVTFLPKGSSIAGGGDKAASGESYDRIRDVLDRLDEGRSQTEAAIANFYHSLQEGTSKPSTAGPNSDRPARSRSLLAHNLDLSWKEGGRVFPRKSSQVGEGHQVLSIPPAGTYDPLELADPAVLWDPAEAASLQDEEGGLPILNDVPANKREGALDLLVERKYIPGDDFVEVAATLPAHNGSDWPPEKKAKFSESVFSLRKDLNGVRAAMEIDMAICLAHYYGVFKHSDDYRLVKTVLHDEKLDKKKAALLAAANSASGTDAPPVGQTAIEPDACVICDDGGELLICDGCEGEYHMECMDPPLKSIPEGQWFCDECVNHKLLAYRDCLVRESGLFETKEDSGSEGPMVLKPSVEALASIKKMASGISRLLAPDDDQDEGVEDAEPTAKEEDIGNVGRKRKAGVD